MNKKRIHIKTVGRDARVAYLSLPGHNHVPGVVKKTVRIEALVEGYKGPMVNLDFNTENRLIGIEVVVFDSDIQACGTPIVAQTSTSRVEPGIADKT